MRYKYLGIVLILALSGITPSDSALAQTLIGRNSPTSPVTVDSAVWPRKSYDVQSYDITLDWRNVFQDKTHLFQASTLIDLTLLSDTDTLVFDAAEMKIDTVQIGDTIWTNGLYQPDGNSEIKIPVPQNLRSSGSEFTVKIAYSRTSQQDDGMYFYPKHTYVGRGQIGDSVFVEEDLAYTMSEPLDALKWMPCNNYPYDKANSRINIIVPEGYDAQSNGTLQSIDSNSDGSHTYRWKSDRPIASYLMVADASKFLEWSDEYHRISDPTDSVRVVYFAWPPDFNETTVTDGSKYNAHYALRNTPLMLAAFSKRFGEFPFLQYGQVPVQPFGYGGMEHQTMTTITRTWFRGHDEDGIAHELFHQWFGDKTTCETFSDIWLNEGFATFGEAIWEEDQRGPDAYRGVIETKAREFFGNSQGVNNIPVYNPPIDNVFNYPTTYARGGLVLHMLRRFLDDDSLFFNTLKDYSAAFAYKTANTAQFRDFIQSRDGSRVQIPLTDFINQWIYQPDIPIYTMSWAQAGNTLILHSVQSQKATDHYSMPLRFKAYKNGIATDVVFYNTAREETMTTPVGFTVDSLIFDQNSVILSVVNGDTDVSLIPSKVPFKFIPISKDQRLGVGIAETATDGLRLSVSYQSGGTMLKFAPVVSASATLRVTDAIGRILSVEHISHGIGQYAISEALPNGTYFATLVDGKARGSVKIEIVR